MKPSDIALFTPPLVGAFNKCEAECAAGLLVFALAKSGDIWKRISDERMGVVIGEALLANEDPIASWQRNPFFRVDFHRLEKDGFVERTLSADGDCMSFTTRGLERLKRWIVLPR